MNREDRRVLRRAAKMLLVSAQDYREACQVRGQLWACCGDPSGKCYGKRAHDAHIRTADQLKAMAK